MSLTHHSLAHISVYPTSIATDGHRRAMKTTTTQGSIVLVSGGCVGVFKGKLGHFSPVNPEKDQTEKNLQELT